MARITARDKNDGKKFKYSQHVITTARVNGYCYFSSYLNTELREVIRDLEKADCGEIFHCKKFGHVFRIDQD